MANTTTQPSVSVSFDRQAAFLVLTIHQLRQAEVMGAAAITNLPRWETQAASASRAAPTKVCLIVEKCKTTSR